VCVYIYIYIYIILALSVNQLLPMGGYFYVKFVEYDIKVSFPHIIVNVDISVSKVTSLLSITFCMDERRDSSSDSAIRLRAKKILHMAAILIFLILQNLPQPKLRLLSCASYYLALTLFSRLSFVRPSCYCYRLLEIRRTWRSYRVLLT
jgi:hypothetical protein